MSGGSAPVYGLFAAKLDSTGQHAIYSTVIAGPATATFCSPIQDGGLQESSGYGSGNALVAGTTDDKLPAYRGLTSAHGGRRYENPAPLEMN